MIEPGVQKHEQAVREPLLDAIRAPDVGPAATINTEP